MQNEPPGTRKHVLHVTHVKVSPPLMLLRLIMLSGSKLTTVRLFNANFLLTILFFILFLLYFKFSGPTSAVGATAKTEKRKASPLPKDTFFVKHFMDKGSDRSTDNTPGYRNLPIKRLVLPRFINMFSLLSYIGHMRSLPPGRHGLPIGRPPKRAI